MFVNKVGYSHWIEGRNCHDFGFDLDKYKCVADGCSEGLHSEVGAKSFCYLIERYLKNSCDLSEIFQILNKTFKEDNDKFNYLLFTFIILNENDNDYEVTYCGDGIIIKQKFDDSFEYEELDKGNTPSYFSYNFINPEKLSKYKEGVKYNNLIFSKDDYKSIGIASDGIQYIINSPFKDEFEKNLLKRSAVGIKRLINREQRKRYLQENGVFQIKPIGFFDDDITIVI